MEDKIHSDQKLNLILTDYLLCLKNYKVVIPPTAGVPVTQPLGMNSASAISDAQVQAPSVERLRERIFPEILGLPARVQVIAFVTAPSVAVKAVIP